MHKPAQHLVLWLALGGAAACAAGLGDPPPDRRKGATEVIPDDDTRGTSLIELGAQFDSAGQCDAAMTGGTPLRRLSRIEYDNAVRDLFGDASHPAGSFVPEERVAGYNSNSISPVSQLNNEQYLAAAETIAKNVATNFASLSGCAGTGDTACADGYLTRIARRAFHGTLPADEAQLLLDDAHKAAAEVDTDAGVELGIESILLSPRFLYMLEFGEGDGVIVPLSQSEIAGRLAATLWRSVPDDALLMAADAGELGTSDQLGEQTRRMLADARASDMLADFADQWLGITPASALQKDATTFPNFSAATKAAVTGEPAAFFTRAVTGGAKLPELFTATYTYGDATLASFYGGTLGTDGRIALPPERAGLLTQAGFLASKAHPVLASPVLRGKAVRERILCDPVNPPPPDVNQDVGSPTGTQTTGDLFLAHATDAVCANCHQYMDPIGYGFNQFDAVGAFIGTLGGSNAGQIVAPQAVDAPDVVGTFTGPTELGAKLAGSDLVKQCYTMQSLRYALGREEVTADACSAYAAWQHFVETGFDVKEAIVGIVTTDSFRFRANGVAAGACQ
jgi:hypothetical protein